MEIALVCTITVGAVYLFVTERFRSDLVALMVLGVLVLVALFHPMLPGATIDRWITPEEGISGFSNPATITVAAMFVLSAALQRTGAVSSFGRWLGRMGRWPSLLMLLTMMGVALVSAFINNTAAVAVFLPVVLVACARRKVSPSKLLIPLSYASQFGGVCTLIGTSTNLLVSSMSQRAGHGAFEMFEFGQLGWILVVTGMVYMLVIGRWQLPNRRGAELKEDYQLGDYLTELRVPAESPLVGQTALSGRLTRYAGITVLGVLRAGETLFASHSEPLQAGDILLVRGRVGELMELRTALRLELEPEVTLKDKSLAGTDLQLAEVLVSSGSFLVDRTLSEVEFRRHYRAVVLAIQVRDQTVREKLNGVRLRFGDALLLLAPKEELVRLRGDPNFLVLDAVVDGGRRRERIPLALAIITAVVGLAAVEALPIMVSAILGCIAMVVTRCLTLEEAYAAIDWKVIFLLAGILPLGLAMERSGAASLAADRMIGMVGPFGPVAVLAVIYLVVALLTEFMSNNATAVLMAPVAISTALALGVEPKPFLMAVCFAASTSFATPVGYQTNTMVHHPGGYRFTDFMRTGIPLNLIFWGIAVYFIPQIWPFQPR
jgi:di/tricarboxylate transporter